MFHSIVHRKDCIEVQWDNQSLFVNPLLSHERVKKAMEQAKIVGEVFVISTDDTHSDAPIVMGDFQIKPMSNGTDMLLLIQYGTTHIVYDTWIRDESLLPLLPDSIRYDCVFFSVWQWRDPQLALAKQLKPRVWVPFAVSWWSTVDPLEFCRLLMLHHYAVPKFLHPGQYVVHG